MRRTLVLAAVGAGALLLTGCDGSASTDDSAASHASTGSFGCPEHLHTVFADMHDGDKKEVIIESTSVHIKPFNSEERWAVFAVLDPETCSAVIDFRVDGKPNPPPVPLTVTFWQSTAATTKHTELEFTDPSGTLPAGPLNRWVETVAATDESIVPGCPTDWSAIYADMHDGDMKQVTISGRDLTITPSGNEQQWVVNSQMDPVSCSAMIDFNVPGKPSPPPVSLMATLWQTQSAADHKTEFEFSDPSGTLAPAIATLNAWVQVSKSLDASTAEGDSNDFACPGKLDAVFADMHDGDKKEVAIDGTSVIIQPSGNDETWVVYADLDPDSCSIVVDFNVDGKPSPPPVPLTATLWQSTSGTTRHVELEFTDPSGTLPAGPLNRWISDEAEATSTAVVPACPTDLTAVYADMHDGDMKAVTISGTDLTITPSGNDQQWVVSAQVDPDSCSATVDFNVDGKPNPPPVSLLATLWQTQSASDQKTEFEFSDPSGTLAADSATLNTWVQVGDVGVSAWAAKMYHVLFA